MSESDKPNGDGPPPIPPSESSGPPPVPGSEKKSSEWISDPNNQPTPDSAAESERAQFQRTSPPSSAPQESSAPPPPPPAPSSQYGQQQQSYQQQPYQQQGQQQGQYQSSQQAPLNTSWQAGQGQGYGGGYNPQNVNINVGNGSGDNTAIIGFILSLVGVLFCQILSVVGLIVSMNAKKADPHGKNAGLATAGIIIGWIGTGLMVLSLLGFLLYFIIVIVVLGASAAGV